MPRETIELDDVEIDEVRTFLICGARIDTHFDIGIGPASDDEATIEALPEPVYDAIREHVTTALDVDSLQDVTSDERWPRVGTCELQPGEGGGGTAIVDISGEWTDE